MTCACARQPRCSPRTSRSRPTPRSRGRSPSSGSTMSCSPMPFPKIPRSRPWTSTSSSSPPGIRRSSACCGTGSSRRTRSSATRRSPADGRRKDRGLRSAPATSFCRPPPAPRNLSATACARWPSRSGPAPPAGNHSRNWRPTTRRIREPPRWAVIWDSSGAVAWSSRSKKRPSRWSWARSARSWNHLSAST